VLVQKLGNAHLLTVSRSIVCTVSRCHQSTRFSSDCKFHGTNQR